jgi:chromosome segregation ATPase
MPDEPVKELEAKIDALSGELATIKKELMHVSSLPDLDKKVGDLDKEFAALKKQMDALGSSKELKAIDKKIDDVSKSLSGIDSGVTEIKDSKEMQVMYKKMDDLLVATADIGTEVKGMQSSQSDDVAKRADNILDSLKGLGQESETVAKKIDDLQQYVASLSGLEERIESMSTSLTETKEIVGIIVRQLDDIERKYNQAVEKIEAAVEVIEAMPAQAAPVVAEALTSKKGSKKAQKEKEPEVPKSKLPSSIDEIMKSLLTMVNPQTEAREMAKSLEDARDRLIPMLKEHTPVLHDFGKRARELKSYPPTALLNENDIAGLNTEIRTWTSKLKEIAKGG